MKAYLCLGSNQGDSKALITAAIRLIADLPGCKLLRSSHLLETEPYGMIYQPRFWNQIVELETELEPHNLLHQTQEIELRLGRIRTIKWGPRLIDIDILLFDDKVIQDSELIVPHPDFQRRDFALKLLCELIPDYIHPIINKTIAELYAELKQEETQ